MKAKAEIKTMNESQKKQVKDKYRMSQKSIQS